MKTGEPLGLLLTITQCGASSSRLAGMPVGLLLALTQSQPQYPGLLAPMPTRYVDGRKTLEVDDD